MPPLTGFQKTQIAQGVSLGAQTELLVAQPQLLAGIGPAALPLLAFLPPVVGLAALFGRVRFPTGGTEEQLFGPIRELERMGRRGRISSNPFTGRPVISAFDQDPFLFSLLERRARQEQIAPLLPAFSESLGREREALITGLEQSAVERGFARSLADLPEGLRGGVFRPTAESPLEFVEGDFL